LERIALRHNPTIGQAIERFGQARGRAMQAGAYPNPLVIWSANSLGNEGTAGTQQGLFQQPIVTGGKLRVNRSRYEVDVEIARWNYLMQRMRVSNGVRLRHLQILAQQQLLDLRSSLTRLSEEVVRATRAKFESDHASEPDLLMAENEAAQLRLDLDQLRERHLNTWREFAAYLGCPYMPPTRLAGSLEGDAPTLAWEPTLARLLGESPEIKVAELQIRRQQLTLKREQIEPIPDLVIRAGAGHDPTSDQTTGYARLYVDVPLWDRNKGNIHTAEHGLMEIRQDLGRVRLNLQQRLARTYNHCQTSLANVLRYREEILPRARRAFELYYKSFREEDASYSRVQSSQSAYAQAYIKYVEELLELRRAQVGMGGLLLFEETIESGTLRPPGSGQLRPPGEGLPNQSVGGGVPVGRPSRDASP